MGWSVVATDNFDRADGVLTTPWSSVENINIVSNQAVVGNNSLDQGGMYGVGSTDFNSLYPNQSSSALIYETDAFGSIGSGGGVGVRQVSSGITTYDCYRLVVSGAGAELGRFDSGSYTQLAQYLSIGWVTGHRLTLRVTGSGTSIVLESINNGVSLGTYTDTSGSGPNSGQPTLMYSSTITGTNKWDDWEGGFFTADSGGTPNVPLSYMTWGGQ